MQDLNNIKLFLLDMDGTIYLGNKLFDRVNETLDVLRERGKVCFLTNNSSRSKDAYLAKLEKMGVPVTEDEVYTSGLATAEYLLESYGKVKLATVVSSSYKKELQSYGFEITDGEPDLVLIGFSLEYTYDEIYNVCKWIGRGKPYVATHPDLVCPNEEYPLPDIGSLIALIEKATGRLPDVICGKPYDPILEGVMKRFSVKREEVAMVGDRLSTDIRFGELTGITSVLVMTGETTPEMLEKSEIKPDYVLDAFSDFIDVYKKR